METRDFGSIPQVSIALAGRDGAAVAADVATLVENALAPRIPLRAKIISIDGLDGVGKSTLGGALAARLSGKLVGLDAFLDQDRDCYLPALRISNLRDAMVCAERVVVEGCMMDAVLAAVRIHSDFKIYAVRTAQMWNQPDMDWVDEREILFGEMSADELIAAEEGSARRWAAAPLPFGGGGEDYSGLPGLRKELITYHRGFAPHRSADLIVKFARMN